MLFDATEEIPSSCVLFRYKYPPSYQYYHASPLLFISYLALILDIVTSHEYFLMFFAQICTEF